MSVALASPQTDGRCWVTASRVMLKGTLSIWNGIWNQTGVPNDDDIWLQVGYLGSTLAKG